MWMAKRIVSWNMSCIWQLTVLGLSSKFCIKFLTINKCISCEGNGDKTVDQLLRSFSFDVLFAKVISQMVKNLEIIEQGMLRQDS